MGIERLVARVNLQEGQAHFFVPRVAELVDQLLSLTNHVLLKQVDYEREDPEQLMLLDFATKQRDHLRSIRILIDHGQDGDAGSISRIMIEGMAQLLWAFQNRPTGPEDWYWFGLVMDWRQIKENELSGTEAPLEMKQVLEDLLKIHGQRYLSDKALSRQAKGLAPPVDPYRRQWHRLSMAEIFEKVRGKDMYDAVYRVLSERIHWNPREILRSLEFDSETSTTYKTSDARIALGSLVYGFQSLHQCLDIAVTYFDLEVKPHLDKLLLGFEETSQLTPEQPLP